MELRTLRYFVAVCDAGSVRAAASAVHVAQPSLSRQIRGLETTLGFALFQRTPRGITLTSAGKAYLPVARDLLLRADRAEAAACAISAGGATALTVVAASTTITDVVSPFVARTGADGGIIANAIEAHPEGVYATLERGDADFAIGTLAPPDDYESIVLGRAYVWAMLPLSHELAELERIELSELIRHPLIVMDRTHRARQLFDEMMTDAGLSYTATLQTSVAALAQGLAASGRGIAILSDDPLFGLTTVPICYDGTDLSITLYGVWEPGHYAAEKITQCLRSLSRFNQQVYPAINPSS